VKRFSLRWSDFQRRKPVNDDREQAFKDSPMSLFVERKRRKIVRNAVFGKTP
jgi:hypothetical protein